MKRKSKRQSNRLAKKNCEVTLNIVNAELIARDVPKLSSTYHGSGILLKSLDDNENTFMSSDSYKVNKCSPITSNHSENLTRFESYVGMVDDQNQNISDSCEDSSDSSYEDNLHSESNNGPSESTIENTVVMGQNARPSVSSKEFLRIWALQNNVTHTALTELLKWFKSEPEIKDLPTDARTLLKTPNKSCLTVMGEGYFHYFGLKNNLLKIFDKYKEIYKHYNLDFNIDSLPIHKSTKESFWPILCKIVEYPNDTSFSCCNLFWVL